MLKKRHLDMVQLRLSSTKYIIILGLFSLLFSCQKGVQPEAPEELYVLNEKVAERTISYLNIPIEINIKEIQKQVNRNLGSNLYNDDSFDNDDLKLKIDKSGDFVITSIQNENFTFEVPLAIDVVKAVSLLGMRQTARTSFKMKAKFSSTFFLGSNWDFNTSTKVDGFEFTTEPRISIGGINIPIKPLVERVLYNYQPYIARQIDEQVARNVVIRPQVLELWNSLKEPILISEEYKTWLKVEPQDMLISPIKTRSEVLSLNIAMKAYVETFTGDLKPEKVVKSTELPPLKFVENPPSGFHINISNLLTFSEAESIAKSMFLGQTFSFSNDKNVVKVEGIELFGTKDNRLVVKLGLAGSLNGTVFLTGKPTLDQETASIIMSNLDFDIKTKNVLLKSAAWLLEGKLEKEIAKEMTFSAKDLLSQIQESVNESLSKEFIKGIKIQTSSLKMVPKDVSLNKNGLVSHFTAVGNIKLTIDNL